jgi:hypothetical protein
MNEPHATAKDARLMRVFLSSTFVDFQEERELLVKRVFPSLRRRAASRGVEIVDVDLRWGVTEEMTQQGQTLPLCLAEIDRCRPYFIGLLGERHGWVPPAEFYRPELLQQQPWLSEHQGGASVTELEILHGVLRNPEMAGYARFYLRDRAYALAQQDPAWLAQGEQEHQRLETLKHKVRTSGFPVVEGLANPQAIASRIEADLWELIEQQYPDLDEADALEREERQHASYRRSRLGVYLGGKRSINQLERWIDSGQQKILITGESGAGKSALIANWIEAHRQNHPEDVVFAHHLGCSNDASAIRPLLARLIDTAKQQLPEIYGYSLSVPQDWWELVAKAVEALQSLGRWTQQSNHRWIWVLDGLDRLDPDDQKALPWLPLTIPEGVVIVASALECPAREILMERKCKTRTVAPLTAKEQDDLIKQYLARFTKQLITELRQNILSHPLAGSPLFLRVLLEELRQCGRYETLAEQLSGYLSVETIDDLYERVLERLEADGNGKNVRKVMTALWASRAGLSEEELLSITGLKPLQSAPINLALEEALGRNGSRLVFDHDYLRKAVENRYLPTEVAKRQVHSDLASWLEGQDEWDAQKAEEILWHLRWLGSENLLLSALTTGNRLLTLLQLIGCKKVYHYWVETLRECEHNNSIEDIVEPAVEAIRHRDYSGREVDLENLLTLLSISGSGRSELASRICTIFLSTAKQGVPGAKQYLRIKEAMAGCSGPDLARQIYRQVENEYKSHYPGELFRRLNIKLKIARLDAISGNDRHALKSCKDCEEMLSAELPLSPPERIELIRSLSEVYLQMFNEAASSRILKQALGTCEYLFGSGSPEKLNILLLLNATDQNSSEALRTKGYQEALKICRQNLGAEHPKCIGCLESYMDNLPATERVLLFDELLRLKMFGYGPRSHEYLFSKSCHGVCNLFLKKYQKASQIMEESYRGHRELFGGSSEPTLAAAFYLAIAYIKIGKEKAGVNLFAKSLKVSPGNLRQLLESENEEVTERLEDLATFYGEAFRINRGTQHGHVMQLVGSIINHATARSMYVSPALRPS